MKRIMVDASDMFYPGDFVVIREGKLTRTHDEQEWKDGGCMVFDRFVNGEAIVIEPGETFNVQIG